MSTDEKKGLRLWLWYQGFKINSWWKSGKCKGCPRTLSTKSYKSGDALYCNHCGELNVVGIFGITVRKPKQKEYDKSLTEWGDKGYRPTIRKENINFDIAYFKDGICNPSMEDEDTWWDFRDTEDALKIQFHQTGITPQQGDVLSGHLIHREKGTLTDAYGVNFVVVSRSFFIDDYETVHLNVVEEDRYNRRYGW